MRELYNDNEISCEDTNNSEREREVNWNHSACVVFHRSRFHILNETLDATYYFLI